MKAVSWRWERVSGRRRVTRLEPCAGSAAHTAQGSALSARQRLTGLTRDSIAWVNGVTVILSNSDTPDTHTICADLGADWTMHPVTVRRRAIVKTCG